MGRELGGREFRIWLRSAMYVFGRGVAEWLGISRPPPPTNQPSREAGTIPAAITQQIASLSCTQKRCHGLAVFPIGFALFDERAQTFLGIFEAVEFVEENVHGVLETVAK